MRRVACLLVASAFSAMLVACAGYYPVAGDYPAGAYPGGSGSPVEGGPQGYPTQQGLVRCESDDGRTRHCPADVRGGVRLSNRLSRTDCVQGRNWGYDASGIWVSGGCRAEFALGGYGYGGGYPVGDQGGRTLRCESDDGRERRCAATLRGAALQKQLSRTPCIQGRNWRWDRDGIWVKEGCRADFAVW